MSKDSCNSEYSKDSYNSEFSQDSNYSEYSKDSYNSEFSQDSYNSEFSQESDNSEFSQESEYSKSPIKAKQKSKGGIKMLKDVEKVAKMYKNVEEVKKAIRSIQSKKSRLKKQKHRSDYDQLMTELLQKEQLLKEVRDYLQPKKKPVTQYTWDDIQKLNYEETLRAIKSIQSKKCLVQHATPNIEDNVEYQKACEIERMLQEHKRNIKPVEDTVVKKSKINDLINHLQNMEEKISTRYVIELLEELLK